MYPPAHPTRRALLHGALGLSAAAALTACAGDSTSALTSGDVTLALWTHDPGYEAFFEKGIPDADRLTDFRYHLKVTRAGASDVVTKLLAQAVAGRGIPDLVGFEIGSFPRMLRGDIAERLLDDLTDDIAAVPGLKDDLLPARTAPFSDDGRVYAFDSDTPMVVHFCRDDPFDRYNLPKDSVTWEEFAELGARVHRDHGASMCVVSTVGSDAGQVVQSFQSAPLPARRRPLRRRPEPRPRLTGGRGGPAHRVRDRSTPRPLRCEGPSGPLTHSVPRTGLPVNASNRVRSPSGRSNATVTFLDSSWSVQGPSLVPTK